MKQLLYDPETDTWTGLYTEYPGCISQGDSKEDAEANLNLALESWKLADNDLEKYRRKDANI